MLDFEFSTRFYHHIIIQVGGVICNDFAGQPVSVYQFFLDKSEDNFSGHASI
ncbi:unnamed protein product [Lupinus luteus]|uniref:Uncharacterized protein n=1 Tax=Lupinus luteus TaxID=3873 RepID=A0AAV1WJE3_LUPLU